MTFTPDNASLKTHQVPDWYHNAKLGIFIHWGLYSVPAFGVCKQGTMTEMIQQKGVKYFYHNNPYGEWYLNSLRINNSPTQKYHEQTYGKQKSYFDFANDFNQQAEKWNPHEWAELFHQVGARYAVITAKHHDGFALWPTEHPHPDMPNYHSTRDIPQELKNALEKKSIKLGLYYSGVLDWSFTQRYVNSFASLVNNGPSSKAYAQYADRHWMELINKYKPWILWNDIGYPAKGKLNELFAHYYNTLPEGVVNDRWIPFNKLYRFGASLKAVNVAASWMIQHYFVKRPVVAPKLTHFDYRTPEYSIFLRIQKDKWELTRGIGHSFGYNQFEDEHDHIDADELIRMFVDIVSKNGNMLLNVGPRADGSIPEMQKQVLLKLGDWLRINGEAVFDTRPWIRAEGKTAEGIPVRFTRKDNTLFAVLLEKPKGSVVTLTKLKNLKVNDVQILGCTQSPKWSYNNHQLRVEIPELSVSAAYAIKILGTMP